MSKISTMRTLSLAIALLCTSCFSFSTGARSVAPSAELGSRPPRVFVSYDGPTEGRVDLEEALQAKGVFGAMASSAAEADAVLTVRKAFKEEASAGVLLNAVFLFTLPLPAVTENHAIKGSWSAGALKPFYLPEVSRTVHHWGGLPLVLFSYFFTVDRNELRREMGSEFVEQVCASYSAYVDRSLKEARSGSTLELANFVDAFPGSRADAELRTELERELWTAVEQSGTAADYFTYLVRYPDGARADQARRTGRERVWAELRASDDLEQLANYRRAFPAGDVGGRLAQRVDVVAWNQAMASRWIGDYQAYLKLLPDGPRADQVRDALAWAAAEESGVIRAFDDYLDKWPTGAYRSLAEQSIELFEDPTLPAARKELERWVRQFKFNRRLKRQTGSVLSMVSYSGTTVRKIEYQDSTKTRAVASLDGREFELRNGVWNPRRARSFLQQKPDPGGRR